MAEETLTDRYGKPIEIGTKVLFATYYRTSEIFEGEVIEITRKLVIVTFKKFFTWKRRVRKINVEYELIVMP